MQHSTLSPPASARSSDGSASPSGARSWWSEDARNRIFAAAVIVLSLLYVATLITRSWAPPDEGLIGESAERVLRGQLPHRDFIDLYTGGLSALHALAFRLFGTRIAVLRWLLFAAFACWLPIFYAVCRRFASPLLAGALTVFAVAWSVPTYPAPMPTWYTIFLATAGLLALFKYVETNALWWMALAGVCAGVSVSVKITGVYFVGATGLFIVFRAFDHPPADQAPDASGVRLPALLVGGVAAAVYIAALIRVIHPTTLGMVLMYIVPSLGVAVALLAVAHRARPIAVERLWRPAAMFGLGLVLALLPFAALYYRDHALRDLAEGVFILPTRRIRFMVRLPHARAALAVLPLLALAWLSLRIRRRSWQLALAGAVLAAGLLIVVTRARPNDWGGVAASHINTPGLKYRAVVDSLMTLLPFVVLAGAWLLSRRNELPHIRRDEVFAALVVTTVSALVSFPFYSDLYFFYYAPLLLVAVLAVVAVSGRAFPPWVVAATIAVYTVFGVAHLDARGSAVLPLPRSGGLRVPPSDSANVVAFVDTLVAHARNGYTYATPDCPEVYFLTGLRNPTPTMYEFFDDTTGRTTRILQLLDRHRVTAVAINVSSWHVPSGPPDPKLVDALRQRYPDSTIVWHFTVRWAPATPSYANPPDPPTHPPSQSPH